MQNQLPNSSKSQWTILKLLQWATAYFKNHHIDHPRAASEILLAHVLKLRRIDLYLRYDQPLCPSELACFKEMVKRRIRREPVAYIVGLKEFWSLDLAVTGDVLIPRPETECLVEAAVCLLGEKPPDAGTAPKRILELGTGSGAIIIALASQLPKHHYFALDRSAEAVRLARQNARRHGLEGHVHFFSGDWFLPVSEKSPRFDMIVSNPPYIRTRVIAELQPEICRFEPIAALDGGEDGLCCLRHLVCVAPAYLDAQGRLLLEIGCDQKNDVREIADACGQYDEIHFLKDYGGYDRVALMRKK